MESSALERNGLRLPKGLERKRREWIGTERFKTAKRTGKDWNGGDRTGMHGNGTAFYDCLAEWCRTGMEEKGMERNGMVFLERGEQL